MGDNRQEKIDLEKLLSPSVLFHCLVLESPTEKGKNGLKCPESISLSDVLGGTKSVERHERTGLYWREQHESKALLEPANLLLSIMN